MTPIPRNQIPAIATLLTKEEFPKTRAEHIRLAHTLHAYAALYDALTEYNKTAAAAHALISELHYDQAVLSTHLKSLGPKEPSP